MNNLVVDMEQKTAKYKINPDNFRINIYISHDKTVVIIAEKDNNYTEWLSFGSISNNDNKVGSCINYLLRNSPLPTSTFCTWKTYEDEYIQHRLIQLHEDYRETCIVSEEITIVREKLQNAIAEIRSMEQECPFPWALDKVSVEAEKMFVELKNNIVFSQDEEVRNLLYELYRLKTMIYNKYMTAVR